MLVKILSYKFFLSLAHSLVSVQNYITVFITTFGFRSNFNSVTLRRFGSSYGGWWIPVTWLDSGRSSLMVSAGLGFDTSFDKSLLELGFSVIGLDPLIECCDAADSNLRSFEKVKILNKGISTFSGSQQFYEPKVKGHDSWSTINAQEVRDTGVVSFDVISTSDLIKENPQITSSELRYLKMDIEGAELAILEESFSEVTNFNFVAVEMDFLSLIPFLEFRKRVRRIRSARRILLKFESNGYALIFKENFNFFWIKK